MQLYNLARYTPRATSTPALYTMSVTKAELQELAAFHQRADRAVAEGMGSARALLDATVGEKGAACGLREIKQFLLGSIALDRCIIKREMSQAGDWICWSLTSEIVDGQTQTLNVGRLHSFLAKAGLMESPFGDLFIAWLAHVFYYARIRAAMPEIAVAVFPIALKMFRLKHAQHEQAAKLGAMTMAWANQERAELVTALMPAFEEAAGNENLPPAHRIPLILTLTGSAGEASSRGARHWLFVACGPLIEHMTPMQRLHALTDAYGRLGTEDLFNALVDAVDRFQAEAIESEGINARRMVDACADYSFAMVGSSLNRGEMARALTLLAHWYGVRRDRLEPKELFVFCPMHADGYLAASGHQRSRVARDQDALLLEVTDASNAFLGVANSVAGASGRPVHVPARFGVPTVQAATRYEAAVRQLYCPNEFTPQPLGETSQIVVRSQAQPYQAIQLKAWATTWPIAASLQRPKQDRAPLNVLLWSGGGSLTEEIELEVVRTIFAAVGATVQVETPETAAKDRFLAEYASSHWDVVWLASHGEFDHWDPKSACVQVDRAQSYVDVEDLLHAAPHGAARRLLMLNVCDGARSAENGLLPRIGLAPAIASSDQAVISHLWPAEGWAAATFGVLLAMELARTRSYFSSFSAALDQLRDRPTELANRFDAAGVCPTISDRLRQANADNEINFWGSPAFFQ